MSSVVGGNTTADRIRDNNVTVLQAVNKNYEASSMSMRGCDGMALMALYCFYYFILVLF
jgi:hypothetical protein